MGLARANPSCTITYEGEAVLGGTLSQNSFDLLNSDGFIFQASIPVGPVSKKMLIRCSRFGMLSEECLCLSNDLFFGCHFRPPVIHPGLMSSFASAGEYHNEKPAKDNPCYQCLKHLRLLSCDFDAQWGIPNHSICGNFFKVPYVSLSS
jgi:hypothetical protein